MAGKARGRSEWDQISNNNDTIVQELIKQNRGMIERIMKQLASIEETWLDEQRISDQCSDRPSTAHQSRMETRPLGQIPEFLGRRGKYIREYVELVREIASSYDLTDEERNETTGKMRRFMLQEKRFPPSSYIHIRYIHTSTNRSRYPPTAIRTNMPTDKRSVSMRV